MRAKSKAVLHIGLFRRDANGVFVPVAIGHALEILGALVERRGSIVSKEEIMGTGWPRTVVEAVRSDRGASPDPRRRATGAELHPDRNRAGYRFVAPVTRVEAAPRNGQRGPGNFGKLGVEFCSHSVTFAVQGRNATAGGRAHAGCRSPRNGVTGRAMRRPPVAIAHIAGRLPNPTGGAGRRCRRVLLGGLTICLNGLRFCR